MFESACRGGVVEKRGRKVLKILASRQKGTETQDGQIRILDNGYLYCKTKLGKKHGYKNGFHAEPATLLAVALDYFVMGLDNKLGKGYDFKIEIRKIKKRAKSRWVDLHDPLISLTLAIGYQDEVEIRISSREEPLPQEVLIFILTTAINVIEDRNYADSEDLRESSFKFLDLLKELYSNDDLGNKLPAKEARTSS